jgi:hypothetical protein
VAELIAQGVISVLKVDTKLNPADKGTKVLGLQVFPGIADRMMNNATTALLDDERVNSFFLFFFFFLLLLRFCLF